MLITILLCVASLAALVGAIAGARYLFLCPALEKHVASTRPDFKTDQAGSTSWNQTRWALDRVRTRTGLTAIITYAIGMATLIPLQSLLKAAEKTTSAPTVIMLLLTAALLSVGLRSIVHNSRTSELDMRRRYPTF